MAIEALVRWQQLEHGLLAPAEFLLLAEETGFIAQIDQWVLAEACMQLARWRRRERRRERGVGFGQHLLPLARLALAG